MQWVSLEEAEPIPDISWGIRVLQPPPEQENSQYGEPALGQRVPRPHPLARLRGRPPASGHTVLLGTTCEGFSMLLVDGHWEWCPGIWVPAPGVRAQPHQARSPRGAPRPKKAPHTSSRAAAPA